MPAWSSHAHPFPPSPRPAPHPTSHSRTHAGGADSILLVAGSDASEEFNAIHSAKAKRMLADYCIGQLVEGDPPPPPAPAAAAAANGHEANGHAHAAAAANGHAAGENGHDAATATGAAGEAPVALDPRKRTAFALVEKHELSHNVRRFRFGLQSPAHRFGLPVGKHVFLYAK